MESDTIQPGTRRIKILHIIGSLGVGGCEKQLLGLCQRMDKKLFDLSVCWYSDTPDAMSNEFADVGVRLYFFDKFSMPLWRFFATLRRTIIEASPDIVHTWMYSANFWGRWAAVTAGIKHLVASDRIEVKNARIIERLSEKLLAKKTVRLANTRAVAESLSAWYGISLDTIKIVYNAVSFEPYNKTSARREIRQELGLPQEQKLVIMVASQKRHKNYPLFVRVAAIVCQKRVDVTFVSIGRQDIQQELDVLIKESGLEDRIRFVGQKNDIGRWLAAADVFCLTSNFEGLPNAVLEAMLAEVPVVCTNFAGIDEIIPDADHGVIVPLDNEWAMARGIMELIDNQNYARTLGSNARDFVQKKFSWHTLTDHMTALYVNLIKQNF